MISHEVGRKEDAHDYINAMRERWDRWVLKTNV